MKTFACILLSLFSLSFVKGHAQDSTGMPGDNLNLYAVLDLFKTSQNVEDFEKRLNDPETKINNLDLNGDGQIDYIRVVDYGKDNFHSLVMQVPVNQTESQDVAVIEVEKTNDGARVQIVGDEGLYGKNYIVEPQDEQETQIPSQNLTPPTTQVVYVNAWAWPSVAFMYGPSYTYWNSPWYWGYYPHWWHPWRPYGYYAYHQWYYHHPVPYYHRVYNNYVPGAYSVYAPHKTSSVYVQKNITVIKNGNPQKVSPAGKSPNAKPQQGSQASQLPKQKPAPANSSVSQQPGAKPHPQTAPSNIQHQQAVKQQAVNKPVANSMPHQQVQQAPKPAPQPKVQQVSRPQRVQQPRANSAPRMNGGGGGARRGSVGRK